MARLIARFQNIHTCSRLQAIAPKLLSLAVLVCVAPAGASVMMMVSGTSSWVSSGTISLGEVSYQPPAVPTTTGTYWKTTWQLEDWPRPVAENGVVIAPVSSLSVSVQPDAPVARHVAAAAGEFFLLDQQGRVHATPAQRPDKWSPLESA